MVFKVISGVILIFTVLFLVRKLMYIIRPPYAGVEKKIKYSWLDLTKARMQLKFKSIKGKVYNTLKQLVFLNKAQERKYMRYVDRLNLRWENEPLDPRMIRVDQYVFFLVCVLIALLCLTFSKLLGVFFLIASPFGYRIPLIEMDEKIEKIDAIISREFNSFYSIVYYQFRRQNKMLSSVVREYLPNASPEMAYELKIFLHNLSKGEEYALVELRKRLPLKYVIRFCDIMKVRVVGIENISQMMYLKEEMHDDERHKIKRSLEKRKKQALALQSVVYLLLIQFIIVYWYLQLNNVNQVLN